MSARPRSMTVAPVGALIAEPIWLIRLPSTSTLWLLLRLSHVPSQTFTLVNRVRRGASCAATGGEPAKRATIIAETKIIVLMSTPPDLQSCSLGSVV